MAQQVKRQKRAKTAPSGRKKQGPRNTDPSKPFSPARWEAFAQDVAGGMTQADAYRANYSAGGYTAKSIHEKAAQLMVKVRSRVDWIKQDAADRAQSNRVATKEELAAGYTSMFRTSLADFMELDQDGELFVKVTKKTMAPLALKKVKVKRLTDEAGNQVMGIHLTDLELESRVSVGKALADLMGYNAPTRQEHSIDESSKDFLQRVLDTGLKLND